MSQVVLSPVLRVRPDNFTPPTRTPWGGTRIASHYKRDLGLSMPDELIIGESWEISVDRSFPSRLTSGLLLEDVLKTHSEFFLGNHFNEGLSLLVKLLDSADNLSVQIHPSDDYEELAPMESGKPESWYILDRIPGAGIYFGLKKDVDPTALKNAISEGRDISTMLHFVPVEPGDFFVIDAGTAHAIGTGVTLVEPQRVKPGMHGVTYRYWDWNRRYTPKGLPDSTGTPRALHIEHALNVTDWDAPREGDLQRLRSKRLGPAALEAEARLEPLCGPEAGIRSVALEVSRLSGNGYTRLPGNNRPTALTAVSGLLTFADSTRDGRPLRRGESVLIAAGHVLEVHLQSFQGIIACALH
ncbi:MAG: type I phosphomannose isomerase catalytic subunit [Myxococcota bacterium]